MLVKENPVDIITEGADENCFISNTFCGKGQ